MGEMADELMYREAMYSFTEEQAELRTDDDVQRKVWRTQDGREIPYTEMADSHLLNSIKMIERNDSNQICAVHLDNLKDEALIRGI